MTNSKPDGEGLPTLVEIKPRAPKITPPDGSVAVSEAYAQMISEFVASPTYKVIKKNLVPQRKDIIARAALNNSQTNEQLYYYKGMAAELVLLFKMLEGVRKKFLERDAKDAKNKK